MAQMAHTNIRPLLHTGLRKYRDSGLREYTIPDTALSGTATVTPTEAEVVTGGQTLLIDLEEAIFVPAGAQFDAVRQAIIDGLTSNKAETHGWNNDVRDAMDVSTVVRTSDTRVTITLPATASYVITADETITVTLPKEAIEGGQEDSVVGTVTIVNA